MNHLESLIARAQTDLPAEAQARLANLLDSYLATHIGPANFTPKEHARLKEIDGAAPDLASPEEVAALFARGD